MGTALGTRYGMRWAPQTPLGRWALSLTGLALGGTLALAIAFAAGLQSAESFTDNWFLTAAGVAILVSAAPGPLPAWWHMSVVATTHGWLLLPPVWEFW